MGPDGPLRAYPAGVLFHRCSEEERPAVGDWVAYELSSELLSGEGLEQAPEAVVVQVLPRKTCFLREAPGGRGVAQVVASNVDAVFLVMSCDQLNLNRIERFLVAIEAAGAQPGLVLSKGDLVDQHELEVILAQVEECSQDLPILTTSRPWDTPEVIADLFAGHLEPARTYALVGASGAGKSTLLNVLAGDDLQEVGEIRGSDGKGRHVTTFRQLFRLPCGTLVMDTPGMREFALWVEENALQPIFEEFYTMAQGCRFSDCSHTAEPGCAVREALEQGLVCQRRYSHWRELQRELKEASERRSSRESRRKRTELRRKKHKDQRYLKRG